MRIQPTLVLDLEAPVSKALDELLRSGTATIVTQNGRYYGIIDDRNMRQGITDPSRSKCSSVSIRAPVLSPETTQHTCLQAFMSGHFKALPVVDTKNHPLGIVTRTDLLEELLDANALPSLPVSELMNAPVYTVDANETLADAKRLMREKKSHRLIVIEKGRPMGIISTLDIVGTMAKPKGRRGTRMLSQQIESHRDQQAKELLREEFSVVKDNDTLIQAAQTMVREKASSLLVLHNGKMAGVIAASDIFKHLLEKIKKEGELDIRISGLDEGERRFVPRIQEVLGNVTKKFGRSLSLRNMNVHFKKGKSIYTGNLTLSTGRHSLALKAEQHDFPTLLDAMAEELYILLHKEKDRRQRPPERKRGRHHG